jgi:geranylgeranyl diphosphate synthase, type II
MELNGYFDQRRRLIDERLVALATSAKSALPLRAPLDAALRSPGKRIRGLLTIATAEAFGLATAKAVDAAAAFEMIHASSLILDDLPAMDDAELRRGEPTLHRAFGEDLAILVSVALLNHAYGLLSRAHAEASPRRWRADEFMTPIIDAVGWDGTVGGEAVDLHSDDASLDFATLEYIHSRKTGALFVAAAVAGAMLANAHETSLRAVTAYAKNLGLAFQITDDVLDVVSSSEVLGKDVHKDEGRLTFVKLAGLEGARQLNNELIDTALAAVASLGDASKNLRELAMMLRDRVK